MMRRVPAFHDGDPDLETHCPECGAAGVWDGWADPERAPNDHRYRCRNGHLFIGAVRFESNAFVSNLLKRQR